ncbi:MAG TPA: hypothetical protein PLR35_16405, partial [Burkholderiaceae bacterium]|nr:hypothetical protein [Burkholderiaceae bacterium]
WCGGSCTESIAGDGGENLKANALATTTLLRTFALRPSVECDRSDYRVNATARESRYQEHATRIPSRET